jgi:hypothetical protein
MNEHASLERRYRRLLAWYPRAFRRENEEEILTVLLACAQDGQQRPGLAASADLVKGAILMRLRPAPGLPRTVAAAVRLMWAGAAVTLAGLVTVIATAGSVHSAVAHRYPGLAVAQHVVNVQLAIDEIGAPIGIGVWLWLAWANNRGRDRARFAFAAFSGLNTIGTLAAIGQGAAVFAPADLTVGAVGWLIGLAASVLLFTPASNRYYRPQDAAASPWRGTFGTM